MSASENNNKLVAQAIVNVSGADPEDRLLISPYGCFELTREDVGQYTLHLNQKLDYMVNTGGTTVRLRTCPTVANYAPSTRPVALPIPLDASPGPGSYPGDVKVLFFDAAGAPADAGFCFVQVWQLPTID